MGILKYAILGLLNQKSMTGYDLAREFESTLNEFWSAKHSQIYPELKHLNMTGMVEFEVEISGTALEKKLYTVTEIGRQHFLQWLQSSHEMLPTPKDEFRLQLFFSDILLPEQRTLLLIDRLTQHKKRLKHLRQNSEKFAAIPSSKDAAFSDYLVLLGAIMREEASCAWLEQCIDLCNAQEE